MKHQTQLTLEGLNVRYGSYRALENISFTISGSKITGIVGPNGAGKSTLLKVLADLIKPESGSLILDGHPLSKYKKKMAYVPQKREMNLDFPILVEEVVALGALSYKKWYQRLTKQDYDEARRLLNRFDLQEIAKKPIGSLSGGQQQRVFLARALMQKAEILFLDEPFVGLDVVSEEKLMSELKTLGKSGLSIFIVHHDLQSWRNYFDQLIILKNKLIAAGPFEEVFTSENLFQAYGLNLKDLS